MDSTRSKNQQTPKFKIRTGDNIQKSSTQIKVQSLARQQEDSESQQSELTPVRRFVSGMIPLTNGQTVNRLDALSPEINLDQNINPCDNHS
jgi:hypothetical protein